MMKTKILNLQFQRHSKRTTFWKYAVTSRIFFIWTCFAVVAAQPSFAQVEPLAPLRFVTLDRTKLFADTLFGQTVLTQIEVERVRLAQQTREIEQKLELEEKELAQKRDLMAPDIFRAAAVAFDIKVKQLREDGDQREAQFSQYLVSEQARFYEEVTPILARLLREIGAVAIIDRRAILMAVQNLDITAQATSRIDAELGNGLDGGDSDLGAQIDAPTSLEP